MIIDIIGKVYKMADKLFNKGDVIFREGDVGDGFYQLKSGAVGVFVNYSTGDEIKLRDLEPGQYFGELAVMEVRHRSATVVALEDGTSVTFVPENEFNAFLEENPQQIIQFMRQISGQIRELTKDYNEVNAALDKLKDPVPQQPDENLFTKIKKFLSGSQYEKSVEELEQADHSKGYTTDTVNTYPKGTIIFREGEPGKCMYDIHFGRVGIYSNYGTPEEELLTELYQNKFFGEMGMIDGEPRSATAVVLIDDTTLETIYPDDLEKLMKMNPPKVNMIMQHLSYRLRRLTVDYANACEEVKKLAKWAD